MTRAQTSDLIADSDTGTAASEPGRRKRRSGQGRPSRSARSFLIAVWLLGSATGIIDPHTLPTPWTVISTFATLMENGRLQASFTASATRALPGLALGVGAGLILAVVSGLSRERRAGLRREPAVPRCRGRTGYTLRSHPPAWRRRILSILIPPRTSRKQSFPPNPRRRDRRRSPTGAGRGARWRRGCFRPARRRRGRYAAAADAGCP